MPTMPSGTDTDHLIESAPNYNFFLSIIVNHTGENSARVSTVVKKNTIITEKGSITHNTTKGEVTTILDNTYTKITDEVIVYDCDIKLETSNLDFFNKLLAENTKKAEKFKQLPKTTIPTRDISNKKYYPHEVWWANNKQPLVPLDTITQESFVNFIVMMHGIRPSEKESFEEELTIFQETDLIDGMDLYFTYGEDFYEAIEASEIELTDETKTKFKGFLQSYFKDFPKVIAMYKELIEAYIKNNKPNNQLEFNF